MKNKGYFVYGGTNSYDHEIIMTEAPPIIFADRDVESRSVAGLNGDLTFDKGRYKNVTIPYKCAILPKGSQTLREDAVSAVALLRSTAGYNRLENSFHPDSFRLARICEKVSVESIVEQAGVFVINFDCKPQRFLKSGEYAVSFVTNGELWNQTNEIALPLITVYGNAPGEVTISGIIVEVKEIEDRITLDCETQNAYRQVADSGPENCNGKIYAPNFPELLPGKNVVSFSGGITKIEIIPRWWTL